MEYNENIAKKKQVDIEKSFLDLLIQLYCKCATINSDNNDLKAKRSYFATVTLNTSVVLIGLTAIPFFVIQYRMPEKIQKVEIVNPLETIMPKSQPDQSKEKSKPSETKPDKDPTLPVPPKTKSVKESESKKPGNKFLSEESKRSIENQ